MQYNKDSKTISLSSKTGITLTIGTVIILVITGYTVGVKMAGLEARIAGIEAQQQWSSNDNKELVDELKSMRGDLGKFNDNLNTTNQNVTRLSAQVEGILNNRTSVRTSEATPPKVVAVSPAPLPRDPIVEPPGGEEPSPPSEQADPPVVGLLKLLRLNIIEL